MRGAANPRPRKNLVPADQPFADGDRDDDGEVQKEPPPAELIAEGNSTVDERARVRRRAVA